MQGHSAMQHTFAHLTFIFVSPINYLIVSNLFSLQWWYEYLQLKQNLQLLLSCSNTNNQIKIHQLLCHTRIHIKTFCFAQKLQNFERQQKWEEKANIESHNEQNNDPTSCGGKVSSFCFNLNSFICSYLVYNFMKKGLWIYLFFVFLRSNTHSQLEGTSIHPPYLYHCSEYNFATVDGAY